MSKSRVSLEPTELDSEGNPAEICLAIDREDEEYPDMREQFILMTPAELDAIHARLLVRYAHGSWTTGTIER